MTEYQANEGKQLHIEADGQTYLRIPVKTHVIVSGDVIEEVIDRYTKEIRQTGDMIFVSEKIIAIMQGRSFPVDEIKPGALARFLVKFVYKSPYGIGLGSPYTMQLAIKDVGVARLFLGCLAAAVTKPFGVRGAFYRVCGAKAAAIDGPCDYTLPPYNRYAKMAPKDPDRVARSVKNVTGNDVIVIDANDLNVEILGKSDRNMDNRLLKALFKDNPLGQASQQTPIAVVRKV